MSHFGFIQKLQQIDRGADEGKRQIPKSAYSVLISDA